MLLHRNQVAVSHVSDAQGSVWCPLLSTGNWLILSHMQEVLIPHALYMKVMYYPPTLQAPLSMTMSMAALSASGLSTRTVSPQYTAFSHRSVSPGSGTGNVSPPVHSTLSAVVPTLTTSSATGLDSAEISALLNDSQGGSDIDDIFHSLFGDTADC